LTELSNGLYFNFGIVILSSFTTNLTYREAYSIVESQEIERQSRKIEPESQQIESPEMEHDMEHLSRAEIEVALTAAAEQRNIPVYNKTFALHARWENDDTHAERDELQHQDNNTITLHTTPSTHAPDRFNGY
jgi:hypothetical protein